jgi:hypothetical protein
MPVQLLTDKKQGSVFAPSATHWLSHDHQPPPPVINRSGYGRVQQDPGWMGDRQNQEWRFRSSVSKLHQAPSSLWSWTMSSNREHIAVTRQHADGKGNRVRECKRLSPDFFWVVITDRLSLGPALRSLWWLWGEIWCSPVVLRSVLN